jgi:hypothetical protein
MPTARELLEQADALMRRNRAAADDDIPVLTDAVPSALEAKSQFAQSMRPAEAPVDSLDDSGDVPLLTDKVEVIDAKAIDASVDEGEPSVWLDFDEGEPSVIGDAPDSIAIVPPVELRRPEPAPQVEEFDELDEELAAAVAAAPPEEEALLPAPAPAPAPEVIAPAPLHLHRDTPVIAGGAAALLHGGDRSPASATIAAVATPLVSAPPPAPVTPFVEPVPPPVTEPVPPPVPNAAHWEAMAEEIRMQVLQRIDLFTDTGLRTQLGERLQPIVDRASADLVATINLHVGELLRAYVAEAIEREIDSWRRNH